MGDGSVAPELTLIEITRHAESGGADRASWEGHAALELLFAARQVLAPDEDDDANDLDDG